MKQHYIPKILILFGLCLGGKMTFAQTFEQVISPPPAPQIVPSIKGVTYSSIVFADVDGDNDQDVLITWNLLMFLFQNCTKMTVPPIIQKLPAFLS